MSSTAAAATTMTTTPPARTKKRQQAVVRKKSEELRMVHVTCPLHLYLHLQGCLLVCIVSVRPFVSPRITKLNALG